MDRDTWSLAAAMMLGPNGSAPERHPEWPTVAEKDEAGLLVRCHGRVTRPVRSRLAATGTYVLEHEAGESSVTRGLDARDLQWGISQVGSAQFLGSAVSASVCGWSIRGCLCRRFRD